MSTAGRSRGDRDPDPPAREAVNSPPVTFLPPDTNDRSVGREPVRPVRFVSWAGDDERPANLFQADAGTSPDPAGWITRMRTEQPQRSLAVVYDVEAAETPEGASSSAQWRDRLWAVLVGPGGRSDRFDVDPTRTSLSDMRSWVGEVIGRRGARGARGPVAPGHAVADAVLVVDELVSNAREHAAGGSTVDLTVDAGSVLVVVSDPHPESVPALGYPPPSQPSGRGLLVVDALSVRWGVVIRPTSKSVWAEVALPV